MATATIADQSTWEFRETLTKNGAVWDLTGAAVSWIARKPDGTTLTKAATLVTPASGVVKYAALAADLDQAGRWTYRWRVVQGAIDVTTEERDLLVTP